MQQQRDEQIPCADCGTSFVFSANEAAVFAERGLSPPKRCKDCRRARKDRATRDGAAPGQASGGRGAAPRPGAPRRYTGDVNEYRSPMGDGSAASSYGAPARGTMGGTWHRAGEYRSPMPDGNLRRGPDGDPRAPHRSDGNFRPAGRDGGASRQRTPRHAGGPPQGPRRAGGGAQAASDGPAVQKPARKRPAAELFPITCNACGTQADVPFKPAEGREVFCPACYRARRPTP